MTKPKVIVESDSRESLHVDTDAWEHGPIPSHRIERSVGSAEPATDESEKMLDALK